MVRSRRLKPIQKLADDKASKAAQHFSSANAVLQQEQAKLEQLLRYRAEYLQMMQDRARQGVSGGQLQQLHQFLSKIDKAIGLQEQTLAENEQRVRLSRQQWQSHQQQAQAIGKAVDRLHGKEAQARAKRETKQLDEISTQSFLRRRLNQH